jgi:hypothetical protein
MVLQSEATEDEENVAAPLRVAGGLKVQGDRNEVPDVLDDGGLAVEPGNSSVVRGEGVVVIVRELIVVGRVSVGLGLSSKRLAAARASSRSLAAVAVVAAPELEESSPVAAMGAAPGEGATQVGEGEGSVAAGGRREAERPGAGAEGERKRENRGRGKVQDWISLLIPYWRMPEGLTELINRVTWGLHI